MTFSPCTPEWRATLAPAYQGIDIEAEYQKMLVWIGLQRGTRRRYPSQRRFRAWLNRCQRPQEAQAPHGQGQGQVEWQTPPEWDTEIPVTLAQIKAARARLGL